MNAPAEHMRELIRDLYPTLPSFERWISEVQLPATRVIAHCALSFDGDVVRDDVVETVCAEGAEAIVRAALDCIALAEPSGARSSEEALSAIRWKLAQALRPIVERRTHDALGDEDPAWEQFGHEPYPRRVA